jgi:hypothetical protein
MRTSLVVLILVMALPPARLWAAPRTKAQSTVAGVTVEHLQLGVVPRDVVVDSLGGRVGFVGISDAAIARAARRSRLCPQTVRDAEGAPLQLQCRSRRVVAKVVGARVRVTTTQAAPVTTDASAPPAVFYDPVRYGLGGPCPGDTPSARGECAFARGEHIVAASAFRELWPNRDAARGQSGQTGPGYAHAALRLGDLAWIAGDAESAAAWYDRTGAGTFARLAAARLCELAVDCLDGPTERLRFDPWDDGALSDEHARELILRRARAFAFADRLDDSVQLLLASSVRFPDLCADAPSLCRAIAAEALLARDGRDAPAALALSLTIPRPFDGPGAVHLARAVLRHTDRYGAPRFGATVLAAVSAQVKDPELSAHLLMTAEHYLDADDTARADIVIDFAHARRLDRSTRWRTLRNRRGASEVAETVSVNSANTRRSQ